MTLFRGSGGELPLMRWLRERVWPIEAKLEPEDVYWGARLACLEMIRTGTTRFWDMYWHPAAERPRSPRRRPASDDRRAAARRRRRHEDGCARRRWRDLDQLEGLEPDVGRTLAPHSIYTVSEELLRWAGQLAGERGLPIQIHLSETEQEVADCIKEHGLRPAAYLDRLGMLGERTVLAHGVWLDRSELELIAERGATVITNPVANLKLAVGGVFPYPAAREAGVAVGLGTDGAGSNDSLDLLSDLKTFALAQKHAAGDPAAIGAAEAWEIATGRRAPLLGAGRPLGRRRARRLLAVAPRGAGAEPRETGRRSRLRRLWADRRHHGGRRPGADARRRAPRQRGDRGPRGRTGASPRAWMMPKLYPQGVFDTVAT